MFTQKEIMNHLREERKKLEDILEAVREFVLSRRDDIEKDMEDFGMLKPVLNYFLERARKEAKANS